MYRLTLLLSLCALSQDPATSFSPNGRFKLSIETTQDGDLVTRYITKLTDNTTNETIQIANCLRRDLPEPNFYWDKDSRYLIFEQCSDSFRDSRIRVLNLKTKKTEIELTGLTGYRDKTGEYFDAHNSMLIYFDASSGKQDSIPDLWTYNLKTKEKKKLFEFGVSLDSFELTVLKRAANKKEISLTYSNPYSGDTLTKTIRY